MRDVRDLTNKRLWSKLDQFSSHIRILREAYLIARCRPCRDALHKRIAELDKTYREIHEELWERVVNPCADCTGRCGCSDATETSSPAPSSGD